MSDGRHIAVLGGGQLGRMMGLAGLPLGFQFTFLDPSTDACAAVTGQLVNAGFDDRDAALALAKQVDIVTFDFENVPVSTAREVHAITPFHPGPDALGAAQDRLTEKSLIESLGIKVPGYRAVSSRTDLLEGLERLGYPGVLKTRRLGYDGKGQAVLRSPEDLERAWQGLGDQELILEAFVPFDYECSLVAARGTDGETAFWPLTRNVHNGGILTLSRPGVVPSSLQESAERIMSRLLDHFNYVGVLTIEFFVLDGELLINEIAPRVHNSGHWTIDGAECSQFENHVRAISGMPLGQTTQRGESLMFNWIGSMPDRDLAMAIPGVHWHDYGKAPRPGRKIGHANLLCSNASQLEDSAVRLAQLAGGEFPQLLQTLLD